MTSQAEVEGMRIRAAQLRAEWRSVRAAAPETRLEKEREVEAEALKDEIARMEVNLMQEVQSAGGSSEDALAAMRRAAEIEKEVVAAHTVNSKSDDERSEEFTERPGDTGYTSSARGAAPAVPVPGAKNEPLDTDGDGVADEDEDDEKEEEGSR